MSPPDREALVQSVKGDPARVKPLVVDVEYYWPNTNERPIFRLARGDWLAEDDFNALVERLAAGRYTEAEISAAVEDLPNGHMTRGNFLAHLLYRLHHEQESDGSQDS